MKIKEVKQVLSEQKKLIIIYTLLFALVLGSSHYVLQLNSSDEVQLESNEAQEVAQYVVEQTEETNQIDRQTITATQVEMSEETVIENPTTEQEERLTDQTQIEEVAPTLSNAQIIDLFNTAANNAKSNATQIVQEYKNIYIDPEQLVVPSAIKSMCETAMTTFVKDVTEPVTYSTSDEILENFPVYDETWSSQISESYIESASYVDNGDTYTIQLDFYDCINPANGEGVLSAFPSIDFNSMTESTSMIQNLYVEYTNCSIMAEIDKTTGNLIDATYNLNFFMQMDIVILITVTAGAAMDYEYYYTVSY